MKTTPVEVIAVGPYEGVFCVNGHVVAAYDKGDKRIYIREGFYASDLYFPSGFEQFIINAKAFTGIKMKFNF